MRYRLENDSGVQAIECATYVGKHASWHVFRCVVDDAVCDEFDRAWSSFALIELVDHRAGAMTFDLCFDEKSIDDRRIRVLSYKATERLTRNGEAR